MLASTPAKRPYLPAAERRRQLLDAAGRLFDRSGFSGIIMAGIATEAKVSRQLVYGHFADLDSLYIAFVQDRLGRYRGGLPDISTLPPANAAATMFQHLLTIPSSDRRVIRLLLADVGIPALGRVRKRFVADELSRWGDVLATSEAAAVVSAVTSALLALADAVDAGDISATPATDIAVRLVRAATRE